MLDMQTVFKMNREDTIKRNQLEKLERHKRQIAFDRREKLKGFIVVIVLIVTCAAVITFLHNKADKGMKGCINKGNGADYCVRKLG